MRSPRAVYREQLARGASEATRFVDMTARVRVYRRGPDGEPVPAELLPHVYGGIWDRWSGCYTDDVSKNPVEFRIHPGQVRLLESFDQPEIRRTMALAAPGGGKTEGIVVCGGCLALWYAGKPGGVVSPVERHQKKLWAKFKKLLPSAWIDDIRPGEGEILLANGSLLQFVSAKRQSAATGSPISGFDWFWAIEDEQQFIDDDSLNEVDDRGRVNEEYRVWSAATNDALGYFQRRVQEYRAGGEKKLVTFPGPENVFTPLRHWEWKRARMDPASFQRRYLALDIPIEGRVYPQFSMTENVQPVPAASSIGRPVDITREVTGEKLGADAAADYVVGVDFGVRVSCSIIMKCYRAPAEWGLRERQWWVIDEVISEHETTAQHLAKLLAWFKGDPTRFVAYTGQDSNSTKPEQSDFAQAQRMGINIKRASFGRRLSVKHRYSMVNALLCGAEAQARRRLFIACDEHRKVRAKNTADSFLLLMLNASDKAETHGKGTKGGEDRTHYTDAVGYGLFPYENIRGTDSDPEPQAQTQPTYGHRTPRRS
jgi:hypothetical protein